MAENPLAELAKVGQSVWYDQMERSLITTGKLRQLIERDDLRGLTSNPTIFEKAIGGSKDYDDSLRQLGEENKSRDDIYEALVVEDLELCARRRQVCVRVVSVVVDDQLVEVARIEPHQRTPVERVGKRDLRRIEHQRAGEGEGVDERPEQPVVRGVSSMASVDCTTPEVGERGSSTCSSRSLL